MEETAISPDTEQATESFFTRQDEPSRGSQPRSTNSRPLAQESAPEVQETALPEAAPPERSIEDRAREAGVSVGEMQRRELQSERDRLRNEVQQLREGSKKFEEKMEEYQAAQRLLDFAQQDPGFLQHLNAYWNRENGRQPVASQPSAGGEQAAALPEAPVPPERPAGYDEIDAYNDPDSKSWEYRKALEAYRDARDEYTLKMVEHDRQQRERARASQDQERQRAAYMDNVVSRAVSKHGVPADAQREYRDMLETLTPEKEEEIFAFYFRHNGRPSAEQVLASEKAKALERDAALRREVSAASVATPAAPQVREEGFLRRGGRARSLTD